MLALVGVVFMLALTFLALPWWLFAVAAVLAFGPLVEFGNRVVLAWHVPPGHVRWSDVRSSRRGTGAGEQALARLLEVDSRPVVLDVDSDAAGLVAMYRRLGFERTPRCARVRGGRELLEMVRGGSPELQSVGVAPTEHEVVAAATAAVAALAVSGWGYLSVPVAVFVLVLAALSDWRVQRISNGVVGLGALALVGVAVELGEAPAAFLGALIVAGPLLVLNVASGGRSPGMGDVKLAAVGGLAIGTLSVPAAVIAMVAVPAVGGLFGLGFQSVTGRRGYPLGVSLAAVCAAVLMVQSLSMRGWL